MHGGGLSTRMRLANCRKFPQHQYSPISQCTDPQIHRSTVHSAQCRQCILHRCALHSTLYRQSQEGWSHWEAGSQRWCWWRRSWGQAPQKPASSLGSIWAVMCQDFPTTQTNQFSRHKLFQKTFPTFPKVSSKLFQPTWLCVLVQNFSVKPLSSLDFDDGT